MSMWKQRSAAAVAGVALAALAAAPNASAAADGQDPGVLPTVTLSEASKAFLTQLPPEERAAYVQKRMLPVASGSFASKPQKLTPKESAQRQQQGVIPSTVSLATSSCWSSKFSFWHTGPTNQRLVEMGFTLTGCYTSGGTAQSSQMSSTWAYGNWGWSYVKENDRETGIVWNQARGYRSTFYNGLGGANSYDSDTLCGLGVVKWGGTANAYVDSCGL